MIVNKRFLGLLFVFLFLAGCQAPALSSITIDSQTHAFTTFTPGAVSVTLTYEDGETVTQPLELAWVITPDVNRLSRPGHHIIRVEKDAIQTEFSLVLEDDPLNMQLSNIYSLGLDANQIATDYETWKASIAGADGVGVEEVFINALGELVIRYSNGDIHLAGQVIGEDAPLIELSVSGDILSWNYVDAAEREPLFDLATLKGDTGVSIETLAFNDDDELIVTFDDGSRQNLGSFSAFLDTLAIDTVYTNSSSELIIVLTDGRSFNVGSVIGPVGPRGETGPRGIQGPRGLTGPQGARGESPEFRIDGVMMQYKYPSEANTAWRDLFNFQTLESETYTFVTSPSIVLRSTSNTLQWKVDEAPDATFQTLFTADELRGPAGPTGATGAAGAELEIRYNADTEKIETKYTTEATWTELASKETFQGPSGFNVALSTSGNAIVWAVSDAALAYQELVTFDALKAPPAEIIVSNQAIYSRGISSDPYTFVISLSALQGPIGAVGKGISSVAIDPDNAFIITYTDASTENLGPVADLVTVSFRHPAGAIYEVLSIPAGSNVTTPSAIPRVFAATVVGFSAPLTNITESKIIETVLQYETLTIAFSNGAESITFTALDTLSLPVPSALEGERFTGYVRSINGQDVAAYDGMDLDALFTDQKSITLRPTFTVIEQFDVRNEEDRIRMISTVLDGLVTVINNASDGTALGSGIVVSKTAISGGYAYHAVSNYHVIEDNQSIEIEFYRGGNVYAGSNVTVQGFNALNDVAVITFESSLDLTPIAFANSFDIQTGQTVYALGNPLGFAYYHTTTEGLLISDKRLFDAVANSDIDSFFIQHSALINPGNSGGPLVDSNGQLLGLNTIRIEATAGGRSIDGMAFAIPSLIVERVYLDVLHGSDQSRLEFGITAKANPTLCQADVLVGVCIDSVIAGSYAEKLGLASNDILLQFKLSRLSDFVDIDNPNELKEAMYMARALESIEVVYLDASNSYTTVTSSAVTLD